MLARYFGGGIAIFGGGELTQFDEDVLELAMRRAQAHELLSDHEHSSRLTMDGFYDLLRRAGYSHEVAENATKERSWNRLVAGQSI